MRNASTDHSGRPKSIPLDNGRVEDTLRCRLRDVDHRDEKEWNGTRPQCLIGNLLVARAVNHAVLRMRSAWVRDRPRCRRCVQIQASRSQFFTIQWWTGWQWVPAVVRAVSVAVRWRLCKCERRTTLSWRHDGFNAWTSRPLNVFYP